jgi:hypothetical protein
MIEVVELLEDIDESDEESDEERSRLRPFRPKVPTGKGLFKARQAQGAQGNAVSQGQLQEALARVGGQIKAESDAVKSLSARVNTLGSEVAKTRNVVGSTKKEAANSRMMSILPLLLQKPPELTITRTSATDPESPIKNVAIKSASDNLLPLILLMGMGGTGGDNGKGSDDNSMLMMALVLSGGLGGGSK